MRRKMLLCPDNANILDLLRKRYRAIARLLGIFWTTTRQILSVWLPNGRKTLLANVLSPIILLQQSVDVGKFVEYFPCNLRVGDNALVPIVLQSARTDEKPLADFSPREVDFSSEQRAVRLGNFPNTLAYFLNARDELFHLRCFFVDGLVFHSRGYWRLDLARSASTSSRL